MAELRRFAVWGALCLLGCGVDIPDGRLKCKVDRDCPSGFYCHADLRCYRTPETRDGGNDASMSDGGDEDAAHGGGRGGSGGGGAGADDGAGRGGSGGGAVSGGGGDSGAAGGGGSAAGAGAGGGGDSDAFRVIAAAPSGTVDDPGATLSVSFSAELAGPSITANSFAVTRDGKPVAGMLESSASGATFKPALPWALGGKYRAALSGEIKDRDGRSLEPANLDFTIRDGAWSREKRADIMGAGTSLVAMAPDGHALLVWSSMSSDPSKYNNILASRFTPPASWTNVLTAEPGGSASGPTAAAFNTRQHAAVTWPSISNNVMLSSLTMDSAWNMSQYLSQTSYNPQLLLTKTDELYVVCDTPTKGSRSTLVGYHFTLGASSPAAIDIAGTATGNSYGQIALLGADARVVWQNTDMAGTMSQIMTGALSTNPGTQLSSPGANATAPQFVSNSAQTSAVAVWTQTAAGIPSIWAARIAAGGSWSMPARISDEASGIEKPVVAIDDQGRAIALWSQAGAIVGSRALPGEAWMSPAPITDAPVSSAGPPALALEPGGNAIAAWAQDGGSMALNEVWIARYRVDDGWQASRRQRVSDMEAGTSNTVSVAMDDSGRSFVTWYQSNQIWLARFE